jgi:two-component system OmpR family sensor kinase
VLAALSVVAYAFVGRSAHETLEPLLTLPEGQAAYAATMRRVATTIALFDLPLVAVVGVAAYVLAWFSVRPLVAARAREERFAADAAHELRTPLATISAIAQAARDADADTQASTLARITDIALDASGLLGDLLTLMRDVPEDSRLHEPVDVAALAAGAARDERLRAPALTVDTVLPPGGAYVAGDERALRQLARNLLANAARHARTRVVIEVRAEPQTVVLVVDDDGEGVAPADRDRVFERFYKARADAPGSGLGLAICRHIARRHGGTIALECGARFVTRLPRAASG